MLNISSCMLTWGLGKLHNRSDLSTSVCRNDNLNVTPVMVSADFSQQVESLQVAISNGMSLNFLYSSSNASLDIHFYLPPYCYRLVAFFSCSLHAAFCSLHLYPSILGLPVLIYLNLKTFLPINTLNSSAPATIMRLLFFCSRVRTVGVISFLWSQEEF